MHQRLEEGCEVRSLSPALFLPAVGRLPLKKKADEVVVFYFSLQCLLSNDGMIGLECALVSNCTITKYYKVSGLNHLNLLLSYSLGGQKSERGFTGLKSMCWQQWFLPGALGENPLLASPSFYRPPVFHGLQLLHPYSKPTVNHLQL